MFQSKTHVELMVFLVILPLEALHCLDFTALGAPLRRRTDVRSLKSFLPGPMSCFGGVDPRDTDEAHQTTPWCASGEVASACVVSRLESDRSRTLASRSSGPGSYVCAAGGTSLIFASLSSNQRDHADPLLTVDPRLAWPL